MHIPTSLRVAVCSIMLASCDSATEPSQRVVIVGQVPASATQSSRTTFSVTVHNPTARRVDLGTINCGGIGIEISAAGIPVWQNYAGPQLMCAVTMELEPGASASFSFDWYGQDNARQPLPAGVYQVRIGVARDRRLVASDPEEYTLTLTP